MSIKLDIVTAEKLVYSDQVDEIIALGSEGELGILPHHAPLMTLLKPGEMILKKGGEEIYMAVSGGFLEVRPDHVIVLADAAERAEEIDAARAEAARKRAQEHLAHVANEQEKAMAEAALRRALARIQIVEKLRRRKGINR
jgi:F-type H+-transporting ATPase subunit epsilon